MVVSICVATRATIQIQMNHVHDIQLHNTFIALSSIFPNEDKQESGIEMTGILSKYELDYLTGKVQLDGKEAINARYRIKKKVESLQHLIPLLEKHGFPIDNQLKTSSLAKTDQALLRVIRPLEVSVELPVSMPIIHIIPSIPFFHELIKSDEFWSEDENPPHFEKAALAQL